MIFINAKNKILGRLCSSVAKELLNTKDKVIVVNTRKTIISGQKKKIFKKYKDLRERKGKGNPSKNPKYPRYPDAIVKRTIRGMLPRNAKGNSALKRLKVYIDVPKEFEDKIDKEEKLQNILHITLEDLSKYLGAKLK
jgi:large subunit ribosomal protein L13